MGDGTAVDSSLLLLFGKFQNQNVGYSCGRFEISRFQLLIVHVANARCHAVFYHIGQRYCEASHRVDT